MITIYGMESCPDWVFVEKQVAGNAEYRVVDIGRSVSALKAFLRLRDTEAVFDDAKRGGYVGIPCFLLADGRVTLTPEEAGLESRPTGEACRIDGSGC